jgi:hypothetical protein
MHEGDNKGLQKNLKTTDQLGNWRRWDDNIKTGLTGTKSEGVDLIQVAQDTVLWRALTIG